MSDNKIPDMPDDDELEDALAHAGRIATFGMKHNYEVILAAAVLALQAENIKRCEEKEGYKNSAEYWYKNYDELQNKFNKLLAMNDGCEVALQESRHKYNSLLEVTKKQNEVICLLFDAATQDQSSFSAFLDILKLARITEEQFKELAK